MTRTVTSCSSAVAAVISRLVEKNLAAAAITAQAARARPAAKPAPAEESGRVS
jgi:hypothetical protein